MTSSSASRRSAEPKKKKMRKMSVETRNEAQEKVQVGTYDDEKAGISDSVNTTAAAAKKRHETNDVMIREATDDIAAISRATDEGGHEKSSEAEKDDLQTADSKAKRSLYSLHDEDEEEANGGGSHSRKRWQGVNQIPEATKPLHTDTLDQTRPTGTLRLNDPASIPPVLKGSWTDEEDKKLIELVAKHGAKNWSIMANELPGRIGRQCRERWYNQLGPDITRLEARTAEGAYPSLQWHGPHQDYQYAPPPPPQYLHPPEYYEADLHPGHPGTGAGAGIRAGEAPVGPPTRRRIPCEGKAFGDHTPETAYFDIPPNATHGLKLSCSHPGCSELGKRFRYCAVCDKPGYEAFFARHHGHGFL